MTGKRRTCKIAFWLSIFFFCDLFPWFEERLTSHYLPGNFTQRTNNFGWNRRLPEEGTVRGEWLAHWWLAGFFSSDKSLSLEIQLLSTLNVKQMWKCWRTLSEPFGSSCCEGRPTSWQIIHAWGRKSHVFMFISKPGSQRGEEKGIVSTIWGLFFDFLLSLKVSWPDAGERERQRKGKNQQTKGMIYLY